MKCFRRIPSFPHDYFVSFKRIFYRIRLAIMGDPGVSCCYAAREAASRMQDSIQMEETDLLVLPETEVPITCSQYPRYNCLRPNGNNRARSFPDHTFSDTSQEKSGYSFSRMRAHNNHIDAFFPDETNDAGPRPVKYLDSRHPQVRPSVSALGPSPASHPTFR